MNGISLPRPARAIWVFVVALFLGAALAGPASACRLSLALGLDVSGSVDAREYRLQMDGLAAALIDEDVRGALLAASDVPVAIAVFEWSGSEYQRLVQDWVLISDDAALMALVARLRGWQRGPAPETTGLAAAMAYGGALIARGPDCWDATLDISGDGKNNDWPTHRNLRIRGLVAGLRVNGLAIIAAGADADDPGGLAVYYREEVIQGPDAFVEVARGFEDYSRAMRRKLLKELQTRPVGRLEDGPEKPGRF